MGKYSTLLVALELSELKMFIIEYFFLKNENKTECVCVCVCVCESQKHFLGEKK
jgi:hypothetical protein